MKDVDSKLVGIYKMFTMQLYWFYVMVEMAAICCKLYQFIHRKTVLLKELEPLFTKAVRWSIAEKIFEESKSEWGYKFRKKETTLKEGFKNEVLGIFTKI